MIIVDGKKIANNILNRLKGEVSRMKRAPVLAVVLVGDDKPSQAYIKHKEVAAELVGIKFLLYKFPSSISQELLISKIRVIQNQALDGIIIQLPLPDKFDKKKVLNELNPEIDVDCLSWVSLGKLVIHDNNLVPPSPGAVLEILKFYKVNLKGKHVVLVGQGDLIGKPLTNILIHMPVTLTTCNKETKNLGKITRYADILITGVGKYNLIKADMVKKGAVVIDAGVSFKNGKMHGDLDFAKVSKKASIVTPTPGGVGPITVAKLLENTVAIAKLKSKSQKANHK
jgi:methylenetetrahydrofolate dehydrogenase (NADP+)/methenyltetrahydrofolate cyclohydrolase